MSQKTRPSGTSKKKVSTVKKKTRTTQPSTKKKKDARIDQRIPIQLLVDYRHDGNYLFDFCRDLGTGGVFIETENPLKHGSSVDLTFTLPDSKETLEAKGKVIWVQDRIPGKNLTPGMGVQFKAFSAKQRKILEKFLIRYHGENCEAIKTQKSEKTA